jgi:hypothetical protein
MSTYDDDYDDSYPEPSPEELAHSRRMAAAHEAHVAGTSFEATLIALGYCPDLVMGHDCEGYPIDTRCLGPIADAELGACEGHASERRQWMAMTEFERAAWERQVDEESEAGLR